MDKVFRECGPGWHSLIDPLEQRLEALGGIVDQIKEKYGSLRFYYTPMGGASDEVWGAFEEEVDQAERDSSHICEMCGKPGVLMTSGGIWLKTLCPEDATQLGYKKRA